MGLQQVRYQSVVETERADVPSIKTAYDVKALLHEYCDKNQEHCIVISLDSLHKPIAVTIATIGTANRVMVSAREVFRPAIEHNAVSIILAHNHPSGGLKPSEGDMAVTNRIRDAGEIVGIPLIDHVILTKDGVRSLIYNKGDEGELFD